MTDNKKGISAFTLIELLVVIAIISILAAILFPVFAQAREKARQITCASNQKQILLGIIQYTNDYDETYPNSNESISTTGLNSLGGNTGWEYLVDPYVKSGINVGSVIGTTTGKSVWVCPNFTTTDIETPTSGQSRPNSSYIANRLIMEAVASFKPISNGGQASNTETLAQVQYPAQTVLIAEGEGYRYYTDGNDTGVNDGRSAGSPPGTSTALFDANMVYVVARARHTGGSNFGFPDGHVKWFKAPGNNYSNTSQGVSGAFPNTDVTPVESQSNIVYSRSQFPNASGWFNEQ